ncbi:MAG: hypothetical protein MUC56_07295 [Thermoanaerobaculales bacterium]|jgi:hypothetical protein|nr:hypothetical protein [Thermoanaerobaculales bacterium]
MAAEQGRVDLPMPDLDFLEIFMPYELRLAQRRAMMGKSDPRYALSSTFVGLYLVRLQSVAGDWFPSSIEGGNQIGIHVGQLLREAMRDSDIPFKLSDREHLVVLRDIDPQHAYVVAQRFLTMAGRSDLLRAAGLRTNVGYVIYPLSTQPNFPVDQWQTLIDLARAMSDRGDRTGPASGFGLLRGPHMDTANIPETDLVPLAFQDSESLVRAGLLQIQRIHLLPGI